jgi:hypothetical protein
MKKTDLSKSTNIVVATEKNAVITAGSAKEIYIETIESNYKDLLTCINSAIVAAAKRGETNAQIFIDIFDLTKGGYVVDIHSYLEYLGYDAVEIDDYILHTKPIKEESTVVPYMSTHLKETLDKYQRCKGGLLSINF